jgi:hypothetical protein
MLGDRQLVGNVISEPTLIQQVPRRVVDRVKLEAVAGDSYGVPEAEYSRLIGLPLGPA